MRKLLLIFLLLVLFRTPGYAQNATLRGFITDSASGEVLIGATVYESNLQKGAVSNNYGFYSITLPVPDSILITVRYIGYVCESYRIVFTGDTTLNFALHSGVHLSGIIVKSNAVPIEQRNEMGVASIPINQVKALPALGGETDLMKSLQLMPGIKSGNEGSSGLYVRGGSPDQNLMLLDDAPLYYVNHLGGFVSIFNSDAINQVKLIRGGFPSRYGSRLSSIVDVRMKEGDMNKVHANGMLGFLSSKLSLEGPIKKNVASFIVSFRRTLFDLITRPLSKQVLDGVGVGYNFYDVNAKINHRLNRNNQFFYSFYMGDDKILSHLKKKGNEHLKINNDIKWGNMLGAFRWNHIWRKNLFSNITCTYTKYKYRVDQSSSETTGDDEEFIASNKFYSGIYDLGAKADFEYYLRPEHSLRFGTNVIYHTFKPGATSYYQNSNNAMPVDSAFNNITLNAWESALYGEYEWNPGKFQLNAGIRVSDYCVSNRHFWSVEPRVLLNIMLGKTISLKASYASMQQNIHLLTSYNPGLPTDLWVPATTAVKPAQSKSVSLGLFCSVNKNRIEFSLEGYYKALTHLITYKEGASFIGGTSAWESKIETGGHGTSYGLECLAQKKEGRTTGWIGYTLSRSTRHFENLNGGKPFNYTYDRRHEFSIAFMHKFSDRIDVSASWIFSTGNAITLATEKYYVSDGMGGMQSIQVYDGINTFRMRSFHKLDIGVNFRKVKKWGERVWSISIYNVYNRKNPFYYYYDNITVGEWQNNNYVETTRTALMQQSLFPIIPSLSYSLKF